jgi:DNA-binding MarR family transcriptional regulator
MGVRLQVHRTSVTNIIDQLERSGLVTRDPHPTDRRTTLASITEAGRETARKATEALNEFAFGMRPLPDEDLERLSSILERVRVSEGDFTDMR